MAAPAVRGFRGIFSFDQERTTDDGAKIVCPFSLLTEASFFCGRPQIEGQATPSVSLTARSPWSNIGGRERN